MKSCTVAAERDAILKGHTEHLQVVQNYRHCQTRYNHLSEDACDPTKTTPGSDINHGSLIKLDIDYVDQAKFRLPRVEHTKATDKLWRPQLHTAGILIWGVAQSTSTLVSTLTA